MTPTARIAIVWQLDVTEPIVVGFAPDINEATRECKRRMSEHQGSRYYPRAVPCDIDTTQEDALEQAQRAIWPHLYGGTKAA